MKYVLLLILFFVVSLAHAQDGYYLTRQQHEQIKKNLRDYRSLIYNFDEQKKEFEKLKSQFELIRKLHSSKMEELERFKSDRTEISNLNVKISNLEGQNQALVLRINSMQNELDYKNKSLNSYKSKYLREYASNRGDRIIRSVVYGMFGLVAVWGIYISVEANYH